jgi:NAD(P)-dependent dehydrogenase (short-subunit alcohol dehydrogenase family)
MTELRFDGRVAIVTGAGRGLGRAYALLLAARGAKVIVNDPGVTLSGDGFDRGPADEVVGEIVAAGGEALASTESVATAEGCRAIVRQAIDAYGRIDILVHNAGNIRHGSLREMSEADFGAVVDVHFGAAFHLVRAVFPIMCEARYGRIVLTSSIGGLYGNHRVANYAMAKAGMIGLNNVAALEGEAFGVTSNVIVPGSLTRIAAGADERGFPRAFDDFPPTMAPAMVAPVVAWLAHERCSISGEMLVSIGGRVARAFVGETPGRFQQDWSIEDVDRHIDEIRDAREPWILPVVPHGHSDHIARSFAMGSAAPEATQPAAER